MSQATGLYVDAVCDAVCDVLSRFKTSGHHQTRMKWIQNNLRVFLDSSETSTLPLHWTAKRDETQKLYKFDRTAFKPSRDIFVSVYMNYILKATTSMIKENILIT